MRRRTSIQAHALEGPVFLSPVSRALFPQQSLRKTWARRVPSGLFGCAVFFACSVCLPLWAQSGSGGGSKSSSSQTRPLPPVREPHGPVFVSGQVVTTD